MLAIEVDGRRIAIHQWAPSQASTRSPVLCLASTGLSGRQWRRLAELLAERGHRVLAPDLIGYGESDGWTGPGPFTVENDVDVVDAVLAGLDAPAHLVGHSYGGRVGLAAGLRHPERLRSLALFEPTAFGVLRSTRDDEGLRDLDAFEQDELFYDDARGGSEPWLRRFVEYWSGEGAWAALDDHARATWKRSGRKVFEEVRETARDALPHDAYVDRLGHLPLLVLSGATSTPAGRRTSRILAEVWPHPDARHLELPGVGHMAPVLAPSLVTPEIAAFVEAREDDSPGAG